MRVKNYAPGDVYRIAADTDTHPDTVISVLHGGPIKGRQRLRIHRYIQDKGLAALMSPPPAKVSP
jgi:hypothetical protein